MGIIKPHSETFKNSFLFRYRYRHILLQPFTEYPDLLLCLPVIIYRQLCRCGRSRSPQIRHIVCDRRVRLMSYCRDDRHTAFKDSPGHRFLVKCPQIFDASAAAAHDHHVNLPFFQCTDSTDNALCRSVALHLGRIQDELHKRIPPSGDIYDISDSGPRRSSDDSQSPNVFRDRLFIFRSEHSHLKKFFLKRLEFFIENAGAVQNDLPHIKLILSAPLIYADRSKGNHLLAVLQSKRKP